MEQTPSPEHIPEKPDSRDTINRLYGCVKRKPGEPTLAEEWEAHKLEERRLEERRFEG